MSRTGQVAAERAAVRDELDRLRSEWREALLSAREALEAVEGLLPEEELAVHERRLHDEYAKAATELRQFALDEGLSTELAQPFLPRGRARRALGLPKSIQACVFELDDVLVASGALHREAWARALDELLASHAATEYGREPEPFAPRHDYAAHIEGRPRLEGVRAFLASRGIRLPEGSPEDPPGADTVHGVANRKSERLGELLAQDGVRAFDGARHYLEVARDAGMNCAVVSASTHADEMLERSGLPELTPASLGDARSPDRLLAACRRLGVEPARAAAFETSRLGIEAAKAAGLGHVIAIVPDGDPERLRSLRRSGANAAFAGLADLVDHTV